MSLSHTARDGLHHSTLCGDVFGSGATFVDGKSSWKVANNRSTVDIVTELLHCGRLWVAISSHSMGSNCQKY